MPCNCSNIQVPDETKPCESHKKKCGPKVCQTNCCPEEEEVDCCSPAFLRLDKLRNGWVSIITNTADFETADVSGNIEGICDRCGDLIPFPSASYFESNDTNGVALADASDPSNSVILLDLSYYAYVFTRTLRYTATQECGKKDQLVGWLFDTRTENLEVFQDLPALNLTTSVNRATLLTMQPSDLSRLQKKQLNSLNILYKASVKALSKAVSPRGEGNIVHVTDKTGQEWLMAINTADSEASCNNTQYVVVACPAC